MSSNPFNLTLEQEFEMLRIQNAATGMSREQAGDLLVEATRQLMIKTNVIRQLVKKSPLAPLE